MNDVVIGMDLAKRVSQVHGARKSGEFHFRKKLAREQFRGFMSGLQPCLVDFEACGSSSY